MELMFDLNREQGTTLVLVTHDRAHRRALRAAHHDRGGAGGMTSGPRLRSCRATDNPPMSSPKVLFGFHAVGVRLKTAPQSIIEIYVDATRRDARMRQFLARAQEAGARLIEADGMRLAKLAGSHGHQGVAAGSSRCPRRHSLDDLLDADQDRPCCWCWTA